MNTEGNRKCKIVGCNNNHYGSGYCRKHYARSIYIIKRPKKCCADLCTTLIRIDDVYCAKHQKRIDKGLPIVPTDRRGINNPRWRGGTSQYSDHSQMKKVRQLKMQLVNSKCEKCGNDGKYIHHVDGSKNNHDINNLLFVCYPCHRKLHPDMRHKPIKYGKRIIDIAKAAGCSSSTVVNYLKYHIDSKFALEIDLNRNRH